MVLFVVHSIGFYYDICFSFGPVNTPVVITLKCLPVLCLTLISLVISALLFLLLLENWYHAFVSLSTSFSFLWSLFFVSCSTS